MAGSLNRVMLIGNIGQDPEIRRTQDGRPIVNFNLATTDSWRDRQSGEKREKTEWHRVVIFNEGIAKVAEQYLKKGMRIFIEGSLQTRSWDDPQGQKRYTTEIVVQNFSGNMLMLGGNGGAGGGAEDYGGSAGDDYGAAPAGGRGGAPRSVDRGPAPAGRGTARQPAYANTDMDDEIPF